MNDKIINTFQLRRQLKQAFAELGNSRSEIDLVRQVEQIVQDFEADLVLNELLNHLDTSNSQLRGGLGRVVARLPRDLSVPMLRNTAANRNNTVQSRLTAALLMDRFLDEPVSPALLGDLDNPEQVAMQSLQEAIEEGHENRFVLLEYVQQMRQEHESIAFMVMDLLDRLPAPERPGLLRLIAQDARPAVAQAALQRLADIREGEAGLKAAQALHTLTFSLPPALAQRAERSLRKLQLHGVRYDLPQPDNWRALLSPADPGGDQTLWFAHLPGGGSDGYLLGLRINLDTGLKEAFGSESLARQHLPGQRPIGQLVSVTAGQGSPLVFLEIPFDYGRWQLQLALSSHWQEGKGQPLPDDFQLYNEWIWQFPPPQVAGEWRHFLDSGSSLWIRALKGELALEQAASSLLRHPAMASWFLYGRPLRQLLQQNLAEATPAAPSAHIPQMVQAMAQSGGDGWLSGLASGLRAQAGWFYIANSPKNAEQALLLAESLGHVPPHQHPLLLRMAEIGLLYALNQIQRSSGQPAVPR